jgi:hypothetical protein
LAALLKPVSEGVRLAAMINDADGLYFVEREIHERALTRDAADWRAAAAHAEMAERYEALAVVFGAKRVSDRPIDYH